MRAEELYLEGELAIKNGNYIDAKNAFENALMDDPEFAPAHNSLGWIYKSQFDDYEKAIKHFNACIHFSPEYPYSYYNLVDVYINMDDWASAKKILELSYKTRTGQKSKISYHYGRISELTGNFVEALTHYKQALLLTINNELVEDYKKDIERCRYKIEIGK